ncbi:TPM domain-containing protein [Aquirufa rosea]|uniref:TPM domain-containing protein n=1 Tax=Aquirufa rosea TaxID=2509241 RepID=A0A4Q1C172_9BACT|nr:TPM domain-containing protein [Aquirufa rosea]RXK50780.1 TPM domain-containing protein [Aquirufa rosea]
MVIVSIAFLGIWIPNTLAQSGIPDKPNGYVVDLSNKLSPEEKQNLEQKLRGYADSTSTQLEVVIVPNTGQIDPYDYAMEIGKSWGVGQKGKNNGLVLLITSETRKIRIVTGRGLESVLPDAICKRIINRILKPALKQGDYYGGINAATSEMMQRASGTFQSDGEGDSSEGIPLVFVILLILIVITIIRAIINRGGGSGPGSRGGGMFFPPIFMGGGNDGRGFGGGSGGGFDFGGFGGGDFGGGGAGGDF